MKGKEDLEIIFYFTELYSRLEAEGKITEEELEEVTSLLDNLEKFPSSFLKEKLDKIFSR